jgi:hypothetical protein
MKHIAAKLSIVFGIGLVPIAIASCSASSSTPFGSDTDSGGAGSDSGGKDGSSSSDGSTISDSGTSETSTATNGIGKTCTPDADGGQGSCDTGFICLSLENGTNAWCSKTCTQGAGDNCAAGYTGTGLPACTLSVASTDYCGVICQDQDDGGVCPSTVCTGSCPGTLACTGELQNTSAQNVAKVCQ